MAKGYSNQAQNPQRDREGAPVTHEVLRIRRRIHQLFETQCDDTRDDVVNRRSTMVVSIHPAIAPLVALIAGILILFMPRLLNYIVAFYLILIGVVGLIGGRI